MHTAVKGERSAGATLALTALAMVAFAANSLLCRGALGTGEIDAASFASVRIVSGAAALALLCVLQGRGALLLRPGWYSGSLLFLYAVPFAFAYRSLSTGTGALLLFGSVQATMLLVAVVRGERPSSRQWLGLLLALGGLGYLVSPGVSAPSLTGSALMAVAGVSWGFYSLRGRGSQTPVADTASNFLWAAPPCVLVSLLSPAAHLTTTGLALALASGVVASGLGYVIWYAALAGLSRTQAASVQLAVPVIAALGGIVLLSESLSLRLVVASCVILGGVALTIAAARPI
jgi:drug/metabolite transporter (DMT)-like permease